MLIDLDIVFFEHQVTGNKIDIPLTPVGIDVFDTHKNTISYCLC